MTDKALSFDGMHSLQDGFWRPKKASNPLLRQTRRAITAIASGEILQRLRAALSATAGAAVTEVVAQIAQN
ncbi:hypothetical protein [Comamonas sp. C24C]